MKNVLVVGVGEIGSAVAEILEEKGFKVFKKDIEPIELKEKIDIMHINIPFFENFEEIVVNYINEFKPKLAIINSTVRPETTKHIFEKLGKKFPIVHSPVRGRHPGLKEGLLKFVKFIGPTSKEAGELAKKHFDDMGIKAEVLRSPIETELGKLFSTTYYAVNIAFHQEMDRMCDRFGADFKQAVTRFNETCTMDIEHKVPRPIMFPGHIGGHCLVPNIKILQKDFDSMFLNSVLDSNKKTAKKLGIEDKK